MTEEIIIDGVNVAECEFFIEDYQRANNIEGRYEHCKNVCELNGDNYFYCEMNKNCYYKQLQHIKQQNLEIIERANAYPKIVILANERLDKITRLEQENKALKDNNNHLQVIIDDGRAENKRFRKENEELKEINTALIQEAEDVAEARIEICNQCGNRDDYNIPCKMIRDLDYGLNITIEERDTYRSALEEIREKIKSLNKDICNNCGWHNTDNCQPNGYVCHDLIEIKNKINEVLNESK